MLKIVQDNGSAQEPNPSLLSISRHVRESAEHLAAAYNMLSQVDLNDKARMQLAIFEAAAKAGLIISALTSEIAAGRSKG